MQNQRFQIFQEFSKMNIATIFSGIGVAEMAHRKVFGYNGTIFACEIDKFARLSYEANADNYQNASFYEDVRTLDATRYRGQIGILVGGSSPAKTFLLQESERARRGIAAISSGNTIA